ncbi:Leucine-rich repeat-containing protein 57 [Trichinella pseudospiralis]|uniref:Leucine-rich repeat-containing protein 57 n=1 Tax=Trichinella pseudospiralis TaxID=6337 RepID=A0A0V1ENA0_TRIPS|nr:Leucine-rich repeat-containing protein 57 [Trichinella pseudospiralis]KRZ32575.1 Leucine-rich repeat-containing protein 57 [Trichinella pseudospiralis]KRZ40837.1 Leucine-rich repeat-containing protein 57 [Trichinella pseudospiralis]
MQNFEFKCTLRLVETGSTLWHVSGSICLTCPSEISNRSAVLVVRRDGETFQSFRVTDLQKVSKPAIKDGKLSIFLKDNTCLLISKSNEMVLLCLANLLDHCIEGRSLYLKMHRCPMLKHCMSKKSLVRYQVDRNICFTSTTVDEKDFLKTNCSLVEFIEMKDCRCEKIFPMLTAARFSNLNTLNITSCHTASFDDKFWIALPTALEVLILKNNGITRLTAGFCKLAVKTVDLSKNKLQALPENMSSMRRTLRKLDISYNRIRFLNHSILELSLSELDTSANDFYGNFRFYDNALQFSKWIFERRWFLTEAAAFASLRSYNFDIVKLKQETVLPDLCWDAIESLSSCAECKWWLPRRNCLFHVYGVNMSRIIPVCRFLNSEATFGFIPLKGTFCSPKCQSEWKLKHDPILLDLWNSVS